MTSILTQKGMIITSVGSNKGDFYWRLKNLKLQAIRKPEDELPTQLSAKEYCQF